MQLLNPIFEHVTVRQAYMLHQKLCWTFTCVEHVQQSNTIALQRCSLLEGVSRWEGIT